MRRSQLGVVVAPQHFDMKRSKATSTRVTRPAATRPPSSVTDTVK